MNFSDIWSSMLLATVWTPAIVNYCNYSRENHTLPYDNDVRETLSECESTRIQCNYRRCKLLRAWNARKFVQFRNLSQTFFDLYPLSYLLSKAVKLEKLRVEKRANSPGRHGSRGRASFNHWRREKAEASKVEKRASRGTFLSQK